MHSISASADPLFIFRFLYSMHSISASADPLFIFRFLHALNTHAAAEIRRKPQVLSITAFLQSAFPSIICATCPYNLAVLGVDITCTSNSSVFEVVENLTWQ